MTVRHIALALAAAASFAADVAPAAPIYASALVSCIDCTAFYGGDVTGAPDGGGLWLGSTVDPPELPGTLTVRFDTPLANRPGFDLVIVDVGPSPAETFTVEVSSDNASYTLLGTYSATENLVEFSGLFAGPVRYVRLHNTSDEVSADIDALYGFAAFATAVPEPSTLVLIVTATALALRRRR